MSCISIAEEAIAMQKAGVTPLHGILDVPNFNWSSEETFNKLLELPIQEVYFTGGEPMMVKHLPAFLERLDPDTQIRFNTNCTIWNPKLEKLLRKFKMVIMSLSLDATDRRIDYIRHGSKWKEVIEPNLHRYGSFAKVDISPTVSILNAWFYDDIKEYGDKHGYKIYENLLMLPEWLHVKNAPDKLEGFFPWRKFYGDSQKSYLTKDEMVAGLFGIEGRYPFLDKDLIQQFLQLSVELKNSRYKNCIANFLEINHYPYESGTKLGFVPQKTKFTIIERAQYRLRNLFGMEHPNG